MTDDEALSTFVRQLFSDPDLDPELEPEQPPDPTENNHSPIEGTNPTGQGADDDLRTFVDDLFRTN